MGLVSIRGAITVEENTLEDIIKATKELLLEIEGRNNINRDKVISIIFTSTNDLTKVAPARGARDIGYTNAGLMCFNEMDVENSLPMCIRVIVFYRSDIEQRYVKHVYLKEAKQLRPDFVE